MIDFFNKYFTKPISNLVLKISTSCTEKEFITYKITKFNYLKIIYSNIEMDDFKTNLAQLNKLNEYYNYLKRFNKNDNLTNIKKFYNTHIFISIVDFKNGHYSLLFTNRLDFKNYLNRNPHKKLDWKQRRNQEKKYKIFLKDVKKVA